MDSINLKARILVPLTAISVFLLGVFVLGFTLQEQDHTREDFARTLEAAAGFYEAAVENRAQKLTALLTLLSRETKFLPAIKAADRSTLLRLSEQTFQRLKERHNITHFYFHGLQGKNLLRVHQPSRHGDQIKRFTLRQARESGKVAYGVELGPLGSFTLRAVAPVRENGQIIGYLELGEEVDDLMASVAATANVRIFRIIHKRFLQKQNWEAGMKMLGLESKWDYLSDVVVLGHAPYPPATLLQSTLNKLAERSLVSSITFDWDSRHFSAGTLALRDAGGQEVGSLLVLRDMTNRFDGNSHAIFIIVGSALLLGGIIFSFIYWLLARTEREIQDNQTQLAESERRMRLHHERTPLGIIEWDEHFRVTNWNPAAEHIFGYSKEEAMGKSAMELIIPPSAKETVNAVWHDLMANHEVLQHINENHTKDGRKLLCEWHNTPLVDDKGHVMGAASLVDDITEKTKAERLSTRLGRILEQSWNEIYTFDADTLRFSDVSEGALKNLGYSLEEIKQLTPIDIKPEFTHELFAATIRPLILGEQKHLSFETHHQRKNGSRYPVEVRLQLSREETPPAFIAIIQDISERKHYIQELEHKALYDQLTDLPNRSLLMDRLNQHVATMKRNDAPLAVLSADVVRLKEINDVLGHGHGDKIIQEVANRLWQVLRESDTVARIGGDEFAIILPAVDMKHITTVTQKIKSLFHQAITIEDIPIEVEMAMGIAFYPEHGDSPELLLQHADIARQIAKGHPSGINIYDPAEDPFTLRRIKLHGELRQAIQEKSLILHYQPQLDIQSGQIKSVEALARWPHVTEGLIPPTDFIPMAEQSGLIQPLSRWVLEEAIEQIARWSEKGIQLEVSVNLSARNLLDARLPQTIKKLLDKHKVDAARLTLEVTESAVMTHPESALNILKELHGMGHKLSIDDFGTGYSSLAYLKRLPVHELKIDQSFVFGINSNEDDSVIVRSTIDLAHNLGLYAVAEGVEDQQALDTLGILGCDMAQGYHISHPLPAGELEDYLSTLRT